MQLLPLVDEQRKKIDELFVEFAGMFGFVVAEEQFALWRNSTSARPTELRIYIKMLADNLDSESQQQQFVKLAEKALHRF